MQGTSKLLDRSSCPSELRGTLAQEILLQWYRMYKNVRKMFKMHSAEMHTFYVYQRSRHRGVGDL